MTKILLLISIVFLKYTLANTEYRVYTVDKISPEIKKRMIKGNSWRKGCPVGLKDLRYIQVSYLDFKGFTQRGELITHKDVADEIAKIFTLLYEDKYPIYKMKLVSNYKGNDYQSIEAGNTSAFNCRNITGNKKKWSKHAFGKAIDINPIENPYISRKGTCSHSKSAPYLPHKRKHKDMSIARDKAMILKNDYITKKFKNHGWKWGGDWRTIKDYQHFEKDKSSFSNLF